MRQRIRRLLCAVILATAVGGLVAGPAQAFTITGGTQEQRATIREAISSTAFPPVSWVDSRFQGGVTIHIVDHFGTYWETGPVELDVFLNIVGAASFGDIYILDTLAPNAWLGEVAIHEWDHEVHFGLPTAANAEWLLMATADYPDYDASVWLESPVENHAENLRVASSADAWKVNHIPRTRLRRFSADFVREWHAKWIPEMTTTTTLATTTTTTVIEPPTTTTTTLPAPPPPPPTTTSTTTTTTVRGEPFPDVDRSDLELFEAAWWGRENAVLLGYLDGTLGPYGTLTRRHAALMIGRAGGAIYVPWVYDFGIPTRGELAARYPGYRWDSERWGESLLRSQLIRLLWRATR